MVQEGLNVKDFYLLPIFTAFSLLLAELISSIFFPTTYMKPYYHDQWQKYTDQLHRPSNIDGLNYELKPNYEAMWVPKDEPSTTFIMKTNSFGMRSKEPIKPEAVKVCTVAILGDSMTFGGSVNQHLIYPSILERVFQERYGYRVVQVLNFSVKGYNTRDEALVLEHKALQWEPDLIVVGYYLNDPEFMFPRGIRNYFRKPEWWQYSNVLRLIAEADRGRKTRDLANGDWFRYIHLEDGESWRGFVTAFEKIGRLAGEDNIPVLVVIFPDVSPNTWGHYPYVDIHAQVAREANRNGFSVLDLREIYGIHDAIDLMVKPTDPHPSRLGHSIAGVAIFNRIVDDGLLACP